MSYELSAASLSEMRKTGLVSFADFITENDVQILRHSDGERDSFQKCPLTKKIFIHRSLGKLLFELTEERPIRLVMTKKVAASETLIANDISIEEIYVGMYLSFEDFSVTFFTSELEEIPAEGIVAYYGSARARYLMKEKDNDSSYLLTKGYASGDKLKDKEYPFVFK